MNNQEFINELIGLKNVIKMNRDMFKENYDEDLLVAINHIIRNIKENKGGGIANENKKVY